MNGGVIPHHQQQAYNKGRRDGFDAGERYGRGIQRMHDELKPVIGFALGVLASTIVVLALHALGWFS